MKSNFPVIVLAALVIFFPGNFNASAETICPSTGDTATNALKAQGFCDALPDNPAAISTGTYLAGDSDRGCCILKTPQAKCVFTNRAFCASKAKQANVKFEFHKGVECKAISACR